ncbi:RodZ domain-containing protein [Marinobacter sp.]|uniref:RodZ domain-containing protein n=1 Tax=Marinobacter sp. TaxID=50741 RepID=UPI002B2681E0|nr:RodZ domain-containing protein [Marinobacter sp.]
MVSEKPENYTPAEPVGQQLKRAREAKGLSVSAIAEQQHLRPSVVQAIEAGDYEKIDTELFLKGYVRAYARQVGLNADSVIRDLDVELAPARKRREEALQANPLVDIERRKKRKQRVAKAILWLLLIGVVVSIALYFVTQKEKAIDDRAAPSAETTMNDETEVSDRLPEPLAAEPANEMLIDEPAEEVAATDTSDAAEPLAEDAGLQSSAGEPAVSADSTDPVEPLQAPLEPAQTADVDQAAAVSSAGRLEMTFRGDCWIKVTDATGERLASGLRRQGDKLDVRGTPPLNVVVGAMSAVEVIQFQNEILDKGNFRVVNNRSEFTLEP